MYYPLTAGGTYATIPVRMAPITFMMLSDNEFGVGMKINVFYIFFIGNGFGTIMIYKNLEVLAGLIRKAFHFSSKV